jgi:hypothetical protein
MLERAPSILKLVCAGLAVLLLARTTLVLRHLRPLKRTSVPEPPTWTAPTSTNPPPKPAPAGPGMPAPPARPAPGRPPRGAGPTLPPDIEARIDKTVQSELLGPVMRPPPMALLGIAGQDVFFRAPNGQSGLVREGGELGGVRIVRVGTNRILVQEGTELKELVIFEGIGGESLMPKEKEGTP